RRSTRSSGASASRPRRSPPLRNGSRERSLSSLVGVPGRAVQEMLFLLDEAFSGVGIAASNESQALITNLTTVGDREWRALPPGAVRTIESIALHVGTCKVMYDDYAFGRGTLQWGEPAVQP